MKSLLRNAATLSRNPAIALEYGRWLVQRSFGSRTPVRDVCGVKIGSFNSFSEYHSFARGVSAAELAFIQRHDFGPGAFIDVGANLGLFSLVVRGRFPDRRIIAFEPAPSTFDALTANMALNGAANVECHRLAVSDHDGTVSFVVLEHARANSSLGGYKATPADKPIEIECTTLDRFAARAKVERIAMLKVDVEGFEAPVFRGAESVLARIRPRVVYFEVCPHLSRAAGFAADEAGAILVKNGYAMRRIRGDGSLEEVRLEDAGKVRLENWVGVDAR